MKRKRQRNPSAPRFSKPEPKIPELYQVVVQCSDEDDQRRLYERLTAEKTNLPTHRPLETLATTTIRHSDFDIRHFPRHAYRNS